VQGGIGGRRIERVLDAKKDAVRRARASLRELAPGLLDEVGQRFVMGLGRATQSARRAGAAELGGPHAARRLDEPLDGGRLLSGQTVDHPDGNGGARDLPDRGGASLTGLGQTQGERLTRSPELPRRHGGQLRPRPILLPLIHGLGPLSPVVTMLV